jgi:ABC-type bacteriocin/lantibiotic exporter with double-glycine peptidase domain
MRYEVPFFSQSSDIESDDWKYRGCGLASLKMVMDFWFQKEAKELVTFDSIFEVGMAVKAYTKGIGWTHLGLVKTASGFGLKAYNADLAFLSPEDAFNRLIEDLKIGPVIVSIFPRFDSAASGGHLVVVTGYEDGKVFINDPLSLTGEEGKTSLSEEDFKKGWKKRFVLAYKN